MSGSLRHKPLIEFLPLLWSVLIVLHLFFVFHLDLGYLQYS